MNIVADNFYNVGGVFNFLNSGFVNHLIIPTVSMNATPLRELKECRENQAVRESFR